jgi:hypothetical protein
MGRHEPASNASVGYKVRSLRLVLDELAELITQAWSDYDAQAVPSPNAATFVAPDANNAMETSKSANSGFAVEIPAERKYEQSTQQMLRRIDALLAPFATDERAPSSDRDN